MAGLARAMSSSAPGQMMSPFDVPEPWDGGSVMTAELPAGAGLTCWALEASEAELTEELEQFIWSVIDSGGAADARRDDPRDAWPSEELLDATPPGALLAELVAALDLTGCADGQLVATVAAAGRVQAWAAACQLAAVSTLADRVKSWRGVDSEQRCASRSDAVTPELMAATEVGAACDLSPGQARNLVDLAVDLRRLPVTRRVLAAGDIDLPTARMVVDTLSVLGDAAAGRVETRVLATARGRTKAQLGASLRRAVIAADPAAAEQRHAEQVRQRDVQVHDLPDGMAELAYRDAADKVHGLSAWVTGAAQATDTPAARAGGDTRTLAQRRADVLGDLGELGLLGLLAPAGAEGEGTQLPRRQGRRPQLQVVVSAATLLGLDEQPGELLGHGPVPASLARRIAEDATWRRVLTDPRTGRFDEMSLAGYEPPQDLRDHVIARDQTCRGPGCRRPADLCQLDHRVPHPRGPTAPGNLDPACHPLHRVKTFTDLTVELVEQDGGDGGKGGSGGDGAPDAGLRFTMPSGRVYYRPDEPVLEDFSDLVDGDGLDEPPY